MMGRWSDFLAEQTCFIVVLILLLSILIMLYKRKRYLKIECWFCRSLTSIETHSKDWWFCSSCCQYNGFDEDGDYNKEVKEMFKESTNALMYTRPNKSSSNVNLLCNTCCHNQSCRITELAHFCPKDEKYFEEESDDFERFINEKYKLCLSCQTAVNYNIQQIDCQIRKTHSYKCEGPRKLNTAKKIKKPLNVLGVAWTYSLPAFSASAALWFYYHPSNSTKSSVYLFISCLLCIFFATSQVLWWHTIKCVVKILLWIKCCYTSVDLQSFWFILIFATEAIDIGVGTMKCLLDFHHSNRHLRYHKRKVDSVRVTTPFKSSNQEYMTSYDASKKMVKDRSKADHIKKGLITPDLLDGHLRTMNIGPTKERVWMTNANYVMAPLDTTRMRAPILRPATFHGQISCLGKSLESPNEISIDSSSVETHQPVETHRSVETPNTLQYRKRDISVALLLLLLLPSTVANMYFLLRK